METRVVRPVDGARVLDPRTGVPLPTNPPAEEGEESAELRGTTVPWTSFWQRRFVAGEIEVKDGDGWRRFAKDPAPPAAAPKRAARRKE